MGVGAEAGGWRVGGVPLHGGALAVAAFFFGPAGDADGVFYVFAAGGGGGGHADLFAVVHEGGGAGGEEDGGDEFGDGELLWSAPSPKRSQERGLSWLSKTKRGWEPLRSGLDLGDVSGGSERR